MNWCSASNPTVRRCRPLLGTYVTISATAAIDTPLSVAVDAAFAAVARIQSRMSIHDETSELSRVNQEAFDRPVAVSEETFEVLRRGRQIASESAGAFDLSVGRWLARWGYAPPSLDRDGNGDWRAMELLPNRQVRFHQPITVDLGGIAKGYAVDVAVQTLQAHGVQAGQVNAGGDLRTFGPHPSPVDIRHPRNPAGRGLQLQLLGAALATSSPAFTLKGRGRSRRSHLVNPIAQQPVTHPISVSVRAPECWLADALTKVVLNAPEQAAPLLSRYQAEAWILTA